jgi:parallel beta-helix repeat protein
MVLVRTPMGQHGEQGRPSRSRRTLGAALSVLTLAAALLVPAGPAQAATSLFVARGNPACSDTGPGSAAKPFCSINKAASVATAGATVSVSAGTYVEEVVPTNSGTSTAPIIYTAAPGDDVLITGSIRGFTLRSKSWITITGFHVTDTADSGIYLKNSSRITLSDNRVSGAGVPNNSDTTAQGIYMTGSTNIQVLDNITDHNSDTGIYVSTGCSGVLIRGNTSFHNFREYVRAATGIDVRSPDGTVIDNLTYDNEDSGIQIYPGGHRAVVVNNVSYNNGDHGIDVLNSTDVVVVSNTVYKNVTAGINLEGASGTAASQRGTVRNNISVDNGLTSTTTKGDIRVDAASAPGTTLNYDLLHLSTSGTVITWGTTQYSSLAAMRSATGQEAAGIQADPRWTDASTGNFRLRSGSPAIDSADSGAVNQQAYDAEGQARIDDPAVPDTGTGPRHFDDRGAYERKPPVTTPPTAALTVSPSSGDATLHVTADASASSDPGPTPIASYTFNFGDGTPVIGPQTSALAAHNYQNAGDFTVTVTVTDTEGTPATATAGVHVTTPNNPPTAALTLTPSQGTAPLTLTADASASSASPATPIASYTFNFGDGTVVGPQSAAQTGHTFGTPGTYPVTVTVTDSANRSSTATATATVRDSNLVTNPGFETDTAGWNTNNVTGVELSRVSDGHSGSWAAAVTNTTGSPATCTLNDAPNWVTATASGTYRARMWARANAPGDVLRLRLREYNGGDFVGTSPLATLTLSTQWQDVLIEYTPQVVGSTLDFTAFTNDSAPGTCFLADDIDLRLVTAADGSAPTADLAVTPSSGTAPLEVTADASGSHDPDADITSYRFDFGDGTVVGPQPSPIATHTFSAGGSYPVTVRVTDGTGLSSIAATTVDVTTAGTNLVGNPGFETNTAGWNVSGRAGITLTRVAGGHSGGWAAVLRNTTATTQADCTLNDSPNWISSTGPGTYQGSLWVRADTAGAALKLRFREYNGSTFVGSATTTATLTTAWQKVSVSYAPQIAGSNVDLNAYLTSASPGVCFYADDVAIPTP